MTLKGLFPLLSKTTENSADFSQARTRLITAKFLKAEEGLALSENQNLLFDTLRMAQKSCFALQDNGSPSFIEAEFHICYVQPEFKKKISHMHVSY